MRDQLAGRLVTGHEVVHYEANDSVRVGILLVLEVETFVHLFHSDCFFMGVVFQDQLFKEEEGTLMMDTLA